jgi:aminoglycoside 6'-N-acetyltransferase I
MKVIPAGKAHFSEWLEMRVMLWPTCVREELSQDIARVLRSRRQAGLLAVSDSGEIAGFAEVSTRNYVDGCKSSPVGYLEGIYVRPEYRHQGIATALVRAGEAWARSKGCSEMGSDTELDNEDSMKFHRAIGFREIERHVVFLKAITEQPT